MLGEVNVLISQMHNVVNSLSFLIVLLNCFKGQIVYL